MHHPTTSSTSKERFRRILITPNSVVCNCPKFACKSVFLFIIFSSRRTPAVAPSIAYIKGRGLCALFFSLYHILICFSCMILHWSVLVNSPYCSLYHNNTINTTTVCHVLPFDIILLMFQIIFGQVLRDKSAILFSFISNHVKSHCIAYHKNGFHS